MNQLLRISRSIVSAILNTRQAWSRKNVSESMAKTSAVKVKAVFMAHAITSSRRAVLLYAASGMKYATIISSMKPKRKPDTLSMYHL